MENLNNLSGQKQTAQAHWKTCATCQVQFHVNDEMTLENLKAIFDHSQKVTKPLGWAQEINNLSESRVRENVKEVFDEIFHSMGIATGGDEHGKTSGTITISGTALVSSGRVNLQHF